MNEKNIVSPIFSTKKRAVKLIQQPFKMYAFCANIFRSLQLLMCFAARIRWSLDQLPPERE